MEAAGAKTVSGELEATPILPKWAIFAAAGVVAVVVLVIVLILVLPGGGGPKLLAGDSLAGGFELPPDASHDFSFVVDEPGFVVVKVNWRVTGNGLRIFVDVPDANPLERLLDEDLTEATGSFTVELPERHVGRSVNVRFRNDTPSATDGTFDVTFRVNLPVGSVDVSPTSAVVVEGMTIQLVATVRDESAAVVPDRSVTWSSSDPSVASISQTGEVIGGSPGSAVIEASAEGKTASATISVLAAIASLEVSPDSATIAEGGTVRLTAAMKDADGAAVTDRAVTWSSTKPAVAEVSDSGVVTGRAVGPATIEASAEGKTASVTISVTVVPVASVQVAPPGLTLQEQEIGQLSATASDAGGTLLTDRVIIWSSSDPKVATVSPQGFVSAVAIGSTTITATSEGVDGTVTVTVAPVPVESLTVSPSNLTVEEGQTETLRAALVDSLGRPTGGTVEWSSSDPKVAAVNQQGQVKGLSPGSAQITAKLGDASGSAKVTVLTVNHAPVAEPDPYCVPTISRDTSLAVDPPGVLGNDSDSDGDTLVAELGRRPTNGTLKVLTKAGGFSYVPNAGFEGKDSFTYKASDGRLSSAEVLVSIAVQRLCPRTVEIDISEIDVTDTDLTISDDTKK